eukprot:148502_1
MPQIHRIDISRSSPHGRAVSFQASSSGFGGGSFFFGDSSSIWHRHRHRVMRLTPFIPYHHCHPSLHQNLINSFIHILIISSLSFLSMTVTVGSPAIVRIQYIVHPRTSFQWHNSPSHV